jgi:glycosyltransferase involved in cell wall biosynthesis
MSATGAPSPLVSFVVPCYMHGHYLDACVGSILAQTFTDFEVLIMDDCSPDDTPVIARTFTDPRVRHVRNDPNLGHLRNYNKGIELARGEYIWLINVDDYLRRPYVLERFVAALQRDEGAAYAICPAVSVQDGREGHLRGVNGDKDTVFTSEAFLKRLVVRNSVATPGALVRKASYQRMGLFELDLPHAGDWLQWCRHAIYGRVIYFAEPMVCYRLHETNMTKAHTERPLTIIADEIAVRWRVRQLAVRFGLTSVVEAALAGIADDYAFRVSQRLAHASRLGLTFEEFQSSLNAHCDNATEKRAITAAVLAAIGDVYYHRGQTRAAREHYRRALGENADRRTRVKDLLLAAGPIGRMLRSAATRVGTARLSA